MGTVFHSILMRERGWYELEHQISTRAWLQKFKDGERPPLSREVIESPDPSIQALRAALSMCNIYEPAERKSSREVEAFLTAKLEEIDPGRLQAWGVRRREVA